MVNFHKLTRRGFLGASGVVGVSSVLGVPSTAQGATLRPRGAFGALGANFNELLPNVDIRELQIGGARWVRGFFPVPQADNGDPADNAVLRTAVSIAARDYRMLLTLKFPFNQSVMPAPDSPEMSTTLAQVDKILAMVLDRVDILEIGNEPFIESRPEDRGDTLNIFYENVAQHIIEYRRVHYGSQCRTRLYMGALNRLDLPDRQTDATERWMTFVRQTPEIDGVDIHPHVPSPEAVQPFLDYILPRLRADQTFLVTEFSLVWYWQTHMLDPIPAKFAEQYGFPRDTLAWQVILAATQTPFPQEQWNTFLSTSVWFESQKYFLRDQMQKFRATNRLAVATYLYQQGLPMVQNFTPDKPPWLLNAVFNSYTVRWRDDGTPGRGYPWFEQFQALQRRT